MRVAADQLGINALQHVTHEEVSILGRNLGVQTDLQQQIAHLFPQVLAVFLVQGFQDLVCLFQKVGAQAQMGLFAVPRAAIIAPQAGDNLLKVLKRGSLAQCRDVKASQHAQVDGLVDFIKR